MKETAIVWFQSEETNHPKEDTMADDFRMALEELLRKAQMDGDAEFLREGVQTLA